uniref:Hypoxia up-regulated protein 1 n=1 Tax=Globodera pallida TaxID=36090 RepID=A0A183CCK7_GLOPA
MRTFHFLDAVCLFVVAAFILLETDASPKTSNTKLKNKGSTSSGNAKPNADASPKTSASNTKLENEPAEQENPANSAMAIDLGSEFMKMALIKPGVPMETVLNRESQRKTPMALTIKDGERFLGDAARKKVVF